MATKDENEKKKNFLERKAKCQKLMRTDFHVIFYHNKKSVSSLIRMPLYFSAEGSKAATGTNVLDLELWLHDQFKLEGEETVFAVVPTVELYSPPLPLIYLNYVHQKLIQTFLNENDNIDQFESTTHFALVVKKTDLLQQNYEGSLDPFTEIKYDLLLNQTTKQEMQLKLLNQMKEYGFVRLTVPDELANIPPVAFEQIRDWLNHQLQLPPKDRWRERVLKDENTDTLVSKGRYVGFSTDPNREYLQLRRPQNGKKFPFEENDQFAKDMMTLFNMLDTVARVCLEAIAEVLNLDMEWINSQLLDDLSNTLNEENPCQYGATVLRVYEYHDRQDPCAADLCGVHADLGLLTVSPCATVPGLQIWNLERMKWLSVEDETTRSNHFSVFAGETLALLTNGMIKAPLHRVPPVALSTDKKRRMSMPFFLRVKPEAELIKGDEHAKSATNSILCNFSNLFITPSRKEQQQELTCREFMEEVIFKRRPWRKDLLRGSTPDY